MDYISISEFLTASLDDVLTYLQAYETDTEHNEADFDKAVVILETLFKYAVSLKGSH